MSKFFLIIIELICWITIFSICFPQGKEKSSTGEEFFETVLHLPIRSFGLCVLFVCTVLVRFVFGWPIALLVFAILCLQVMATILIMKKAGG